MCTRRSFDSEVADTCQTEELQKSRLDPRAELSHVTYRDWEYLGSHHSRLGAAVVKAVNDAGKIGTAGAAVAGAGGVAGNIGVGRRRGLGKAKQADGQK